jgi:hypothetical protein
MWYDSYLRSQIYQLIIATHPNILSRHQRKYQEPASIPLVSMLSTGLWNPQQSSRIREREGNPCPKEPEW